MESGRVLLPRPAAVSLSPTPPIFSTIEGNITKSHVVSNEKTFQFVNLDISQPLKHSSQSRTVIRSQAMRSFLRQERELQPTLEDTKDENKNDMREKTGNETEQNGEEIMFRLLPMDMQELPKRSRKKNILKIRQHRGVLFDKIINSDRILDWSHDHSSDLSAPGSLPISRLGIDKLDPFKSLPFPVTERIQYLLHYSHVQITASPLMQHPKKKWFTLALKDEAYFNAALSHYSGHLFLVNGSRGDPFEALWYRGEAVRVLNERLKMLEVSQKVAGVDGREVSDGTIGAVACMVNYEASNGNLESVRTHMMGLEQMVRLRGGFEEANFPLYIHRLVAWADVNSAFALSTIPVLPSVPTPSGPMNLEASVDFNSILNDLRCLSSIFPSPAGSKQSGHLISRQSDSVWYSDILYHCKRSLLLLSFATTQYQTRSWKLEKTLCIAALILIEVWGRGTGINAKVIDTAILKLRESLENMPEMDIVRDDTRIDTKVASYLVEGKFWAALVGGIAAGGRTERWWFLERIKEYKMALGLEGWEGARKILDRLLWYGLWEERGIEFWEEI